MDSRQFCVFTPEEQQAYDKHCKIILDALAPIGDFERDIAQSVADDRWRLKRARAIEASTFPWACTSTPPTTPATPRSMTLSPKPEPGAKTPIISILLTIYV